MSCDTNPLGVELDQYVANNILLLTGNFNVDPCSFHPVLEDQHFPSHNPGIGIKLETPEVPCHVIPETLICPEGQGPTLPSHIIIKIYPEENELETLLN
ncbi:unnamed protein product, partial [Allacma fusca]